MSIETVQRSMAERPMTLEAALEALRGVIGRTALLQHLRDVPLWHGKPTHGRNGRKYLFTAAQYATLLESFSCRSASSNVPEDRRSTSAAPSEAKAVSRAQALIDQILQRPTGSSGKARSGNGQSLRARAVVTFMTCR